MISKSQLDSFQDSDKLNKLQSQLGRILSQDAFEAEMNRPSIANAATQASTDNIVNNTNIANRRMQMEEDTHNAPSSVFSRNAVQLGNGLWAFPSSYPFKDVMDSTATITPRTDPTTDLKTGKVIPGEDAKLKVNLPVKVGRIPVTGVKTQLSPDGDTDYPPDGDEDDSTSIKSRQPIAVFDPVKQYQDAQMKQQLIDDAKARQRKRKAMSSLQ